MAPKKNLTQPFVNLPRVRLSNLIEVTAYIPGIGLTTCKSTAWFFFVVDVKKTFQGVRYHIVRGALDTAGVNDRKQGRSKYGTKTSKSIRKGDKEK